MGRAQNTVKRGSFWLCLFGPGRTLEACEETDRHSVEQGLHAGRTGKAVRWATLALSLGGLGTWIWPTHLLFRGLPTWPCSHNCWGGGPSLLRRGENCRTAMPRPGGPWPDLSAYARQPARGPTMLSHFVASWGYVGLS